MTNKERAQALRECLRASRDRLLAKGWEAMTPQELMRRARGKFPDTDGETRFFGLPDDVRVATIKRLAVDRSYFISDTYLRQLTRADYQNVRGDVARFSAHFVLALRRHRLPFYVRGVQDAGSPGGIGCPGAKPRHSADCTPCPGVRG